MTHTTAQPRPGSGVDGFNGSLALTPSSRAPRLDHDGGPAKRFCPAAMPSLCRMQVAGEHTHRVQLPGPAL